MRTISLSKKYSVTASGKEHGQKQHLNEDCCAAVSFEGGFFVAVADGVGSSKHPRKSSRSAIRALKKTAKLLAKNKIPTESFLSVLEENYKKTSIFSWKSLRSTLLFVIVLSKMEIYIGQCGDGLIYADKDGSGTVFQEKNDEFGNMTTCFRCDGKKNDFKIKYKVLSSPGKYSFLLCSDGLSEDLIHGSEKQFFEVITNKLSSGDEKYVSEMVKKWPVPGSVDDKSLAFMSFELKESNDA